jgi:hypothetical protein
MSRNRMVRVADRCTGAKGCTPLATAVTSVTRRASAQSNPSATVAVFSARGAARATITPAATSSISMIGMRPAARAPKSAA